MQADGTIDRAHGAGNLTFAKLFTDRSWAIAAAVFEVATQLGRSPAQVALQIPSDLLVRLDQIRQPEPGYPYYLFAPAG